MRVTVLKIRERWFERLALPVLQSFIGRLSEEWLREARPIRIEYQLDQSLRLADRPRLPLAAERKPSDLNWCASAIARSSVIPQGWRLRCSRCSRELS